ncbi:LRC69-like protein [Mya arenaria]|uniref:LRC69-like protein n=1 Tax=Mya arenaria TaxID=6604 RepID=A0ABY7EUA1_MYAAR|nr:LRC69-like protein [Mya arenaria]
MMSMSHPIKSKYIVSSMKTPLTHIAIMRLGPRQGCLVLCIQGEQGTGKLQLRRFYTEQRKMADTLLIRALKSKPKALNLSNKKLDRVPKAIGKLDCIIHLQLKNNSLKTLPFELSYLDQILNCGNNQFEVLPDVIEHLFMLEKLHLFNNQIHTLTPKALTNLRSLTFLNLNSNALKFLSVDKNLLTELPIELCALTRLEEFHCANNQLTSLPLEFGMPLKELFCEENPLLQHIPVHSVQEEEVLSLKVVVFAALHKALPTDPRDAGAGVKVRGVWGILSEHLARMCEIHRRQIVRALLCSYKCFNAKGHDYYGVAFP